MADQCMSDELVRNCELHSGNEEGQRQHSCSAYLSDDQMAGVTAKERGQLSLPSVERDSGTESDEELEMIETNSMASFAFSQTSDCYASHPSWSISSCHSPNGSPQCHQFSDQDLNGFDPSALPAAAVNHVEQVSVVAEPPELPTHHYHTRQQFQRLKQHCAELLPSVDSQIGAKTAFISLKRCRQQLQPVDDDDDDGEEDSASRWPQMERRLAPVRLLIPPAPSSEDECLKEEEQDSASANLSPRKKTRHSALKSGDADHSNSTRPCLNFEKMQQKLVKPLRKKTANRENMKAKVKLRAWSDGYQLRSCGSTYLFRPLDISTDDSQVDSDINDLVRNNCHL